MPLELLTPDTLAPLLGCRPATVRERARSGDLPGLKFGDDWVFPADALRQRLTEKALEDALLRRQPKQLSGTLQGQSTARTKRRPPALPQL